MTCVEVVKVVGGVLRVKPVMKLAAIGLMPMSRVMAEVGTLVISLSARMT